MQRQGGQTLSWSCRAPEEGGLRAGDTSLPCSTAHIRTIWGMRAASALSAGVQGSCWCPSLCAGDPSWRGESQPYTGGGDGCTTRVCLCVRTGAATSTCTGQCDSYRMLPTGGSLMHHPGGKVLGVMAEPCQGWAPGLHTLSPVLQQWQVCCAGAARSQLCFSPTGPRCLPQSRDISWGKWPA